MRQKDKGTKDPKIMSGGSAKKTFTGDVPRTLPNFQTNMTQSSNKNYKETTTSISTTKDSFSPPSIRAPNNTPTPDDPILPPLQKNNDMVLQSSIVSGEHPHHSNEITPLTINKHSSSLSSTLNPGNKSVPIKKRKGKHNTHYTTFTGNHHHNNKDISTVSTKKIREINSNEFLLPPLNLKFINMINTDSTIHPYPYHKEKNCIQKLKTVQLPKPLISSPLSHSSCDSIMGSNKKPIVQQQQNDEDHNTKNDYVVPAHFKESKNNKNEFERDLNIPSDHIRHSLGSSIVDESLNSKTNSLSASPSTVKDSIILPINSNPLIILPAPLQNNNKNFQYFDGGKNENLRINTPITTIINTNNKFINNINNKDNTDNESSMNKDFTNNNSNIINNNHNNITTNNTDNHTSSLQNSMSPSPSTSSISNIENTENTILNPRVLDIVKNKPCRIRPKEPSPTISSSSFSLSSTDRKKDQSNKIKLKSNNTKTRITDNTWNHNDKPKSFSRNNNNNKNNNSMITEPITSSIKFNVKQKKRFRSKSPLTITTTTTKTTRTTTIATPTTTTTTFLPTGTIIPNISDTRTKPNNNIDINKNIPISSPIKIEESNNHIKTPSKREIIPRTMNGLDMISSAILATSSGNIITPNYTAGSNLSLISSPPPISVSSSHQLPSSAAPAVSPSSSSSSSSSSTSSKETKDVITKNVTLNELNMNPLNVNLGGLKKKLLTNPHNITNSLPNSINVIPPFGLSTTTTTNAEIDQLDNAAAVLSTLRSSPFKGSDRRSSSFSIPFSSYNNSNHNNNNLIMINSNPPSSSGNKDFNSNSNPFTTNNIHNLLSLPRTRSRPHSSSFSSALKNFTRPILRIHHKEKPSKIKINKDNNSSALISSSDDTEDDEINKDKEIIEKDEIIKPPVTKKRKYQKRKNRKNAKINKDDTVTWNKNGKRIDKEIISSKTIPPMTQIKRVKEPIVKKKRKSIKKIQAEAAEAAVLALHQLDPEKYPLPANHPDAPPKPKKPRTRRSSDGTPATRSRSGCWICRLRKKKCSEEKPKCSNCQRLHLDCDYSVERPDFVTNEELRKAKLQEIKFHTRESKRKTMRQQNIDRSTQARAAKELKTLFDKNIELKKGNNDKDKDNNKETKLANNVTNIKDKANDDLKKTNGSESTEKTPEQSNNNTTNSEIEIRHVSSPVSAGITKDDKTIIQKN